MTSLNVEQARAALGLAEDLRTRLLTRGLEDFVQRTEGTTARTRSRSQRD